MVMMMGGGGGGGICACAAMAQECKTGTEKGEKGADAREEVEMAKRGKEGNWHQQN